MPKPRINPVAGIIILLILGIGSGYGIYAMGRGVESSPIGLQVISRPVKTNATEANVYQNTVYGFEFTAPSGWTVTETKPTNIPDTFLTVTMKDGLTSDRLMFTVISPELESAVRNSLSLVTEKNTLLGTLTADELIGTDLKDGSPITMVIAKSGNYLFEITSYAPALVLDSFLTSFKIVQ